MQRLLMRRNSGTTTARRRSDASNQGQEHAFTTSGTWQVKYPEHTNAPLGARKPRAQVTCSQGTKSRTWSVPLTVARSLENADECDVADISELATRIHDKAHVCAWAQLMKKISRREYASLELSQALQRDGYSRECVEEVIARASKARFVNDTRFAESFIRSKLSAGWGPVRIERELSQRGISADEIAGWPDEFFEDESIESRALQLLAKKRIPENNAFPKLARFLVSRGYSPAVAREVTNSILSDDI